MLAPKMMLASLSAAAVIISTASLMSTMEQLELQVTLMSTARAPSMLVSSIGEEIAFCAASAMAFSPLPTPMPRCAMPPDSITAFTSAKSRLMMPV